MARTSARFGFTIEALHRIEADGGDAVEAVRVQGLRIGIRIARLVAEAQAGSQVELRTRARDGRLVMDAVVSADGSLQGRRSGIADDEDSLRHLAEELGGLLSEYATTGPCLDLLPAPAEEQPRPALLVLPRGGGSGLRPAGFLDTAGSGGGTWASPRTSEAASLARLLLANPHVVLTQQVTALPDDAVEQARKRLAVDLRDMNTPLAEALGTPVRARTAVVAVAAPWTLPLRLREHLRGWFDFIDLDEVVLDGEATAPVLPELVAGGLLRFPTTSAPTFPGVDIEPATVPLDTTELAAGGVRIGSATDSQHRARDVRLSTSAMSRHVHVIGEPGSGKSTLLTALALEMADQGQGLLLLDPHGTTVDRVLAELPPQHRDRVLVIRCGDTANPVRLNPFATERPDLQDIVISDMTDAFQTLFDPKGEGIVGPRFQHIMKHALSTLALVRGPRASLLDVPRLLYQRDLLMAVLQHVKDPELVSFWENDILSNRSGEMQEVIAWVSSKFTTFATNRATKAMLATGADSLDPLQAMAEDRIVLVDLDRGTAGSVGARVLGLLYLLRFWVAALDRPEPRPFGIIVDEASSFSAVALPAILSEGRKFGLQAVVAHQFMGQLVPALAEALEGSAATRIVFRVGPDDARTIATTTYPEFGPLDLSSLPQFVSAARVASSGEVLRPFTLRVDHNQRVSAQPDAAQAVAQMTRRSIEQLVDPHRDAAPMAIDDVGGPPPAPTPSRRRPGRLRPTDPLSEELSWAKSLDDLFGGSGASGRPDDD